MVWYGMVTKTRQGKCNREQKGMEGELRNRRASDLCSRDHLVHDLREVTPEAGGESKGI